jgi:hypothetical protein
MNVVRQDTDRDRFKWTPFAGKPIGRSQTLDLLNE